MNIAARTRNPALSAATAILLWIVTANAASAGSLSLSQTPLFLTTGVEANVLITYDDSGSMRWGFLPDSIDTSAIRTGARGCSNTINRIYYDPNVTYVPGVDESGNSLGSANFTAAWINGFNQGAGTVNLSTNYQAAWVMDSTVTGIVTVASCGTGTTSGQAAFYYVYDPTTTACAPADVNNDSCYRRVTVSATSGPGGSDERQNFANWYSYYRMRTQLAKTAVGRALSRVGQNIRLAGQHLNNTSATSPDRFTTTIGLMRKFTGAARTDFFTRLYNSPANGSTPLRPAAQRAGTYFGTGNTGANSPYRDTPGDSTTAERSCRQNFHVVFTDGFWNSGAGVGGNIDGSAQTLGDASAYAVPKGPYSDDWSATLADNTFDAWYRDLRPDLTNDVPAYFADESGATPADNFWNPVNDPATWQHVTTFTIGLGIDGTLPFDTTTYNNLVNGTQAWPNPGAGDNPQAVDDLWHAALNGRGRYFSAGKPNDFVNAFTEALRNIERRVGSFTAVATSSYFVSSGSTLSIFQVFFNSNGWYGGLLKYTGTLVDVGGGVLNLVVSGPDWDAAAQVDTQSQNPFSDRQVLTYDPVSKTGRPFVWANLGATQQAALGDDPDTLPVENDAAAGQARLAFLRGEDAQEGNTSGYNFRVRGSTKLGDIVNSQPLYVGPSPFKYADSLADSPNHSTFRAAVDSRTPIVYVGGNDGMLHGFDAATGRERIAYVPSPVFRNLNRLSSRSYQHQYFTDGSPVVGDVYVGGAWKTYLVGGLNAGGQGIYALDVTNPTQFTESNASTLVRWEFTDTYDRDGDPTNGVDGADLGYTFGKPVIARVRAGGSTVKWAVIFGNGYNNRDPDASQSTTGHAVLYVVDAANGSLMAKLSTKTGTTATPNGLSSPAIVDFDGDRIVDYVYAGDLQGNMWKFDLTNTNPSNWASAYGTGTTPRPLFKAVDASNSGQPITIPPQITFHPIGPGFIVMFGTGKYLENGDHSAVGQQVQSVYGIWDKNVNSSQTPVVSNDLLQQSVLGTATVGGIEYRNVSNNPITWRTSGNSDYLGWYLNLPDPGERQITEMDLKGGHLIFTTLVPSDDPCKFGGYGWQMELDFRNGGRPESSPFDVNQDGVVCLCTADNVDFTGIGGSGTPPAGRKGSPTKRQIVHGRDVDYKIENPLSGTKPETYKESGGSAKRGRTSWRQL